MARIPAAENDLNFCPQKYLSVKCKSKRSPGRLILYRSLLRSINKNKFCSLSWQLQAVPVLRAGLRSCTSAMLCLEQGWGAAPVLRAGMQRCTSAMLCSEQGWRAVAVLRAGWGAVAVLGAGWGAVAVPCCAQSRDGAVPAQPIVPSCGRPAPPQPRRAPLRSVPAPRRARDKVAFST